MISDHSRMLRKAVCALAVAWSLPLYAVQLKDATKRAFDHYVQVAEKRIRGELTGAEHGQEFLWGKPDQNAIARLKKGEVVIQSLDEKENGREIEIPDGLVHHWIGTVFVPGTDLRSTLALLQDYDHHKNVYTQEVVDSKLLSREGGHFKAYLRFYKKKIIGVTLNTQHEADYVVLSPTRAYSISHATRIAQVENAGSPKEHERPVGDDDGFLWALDSYWRLEQKDGGVFVQCEAISLTRDVPTGLGWIVKPFITEVPKESLSNTLTATRATLLGREVKR